MKYLTNDISAYSVIGFIILVILLAVLLNAIRRVMPLLIKRKSLLSNIRRRISLFELLIWFGLTLWTIPILLSANTIYGILLILMVIITLVLVSWYAGRDIISGFVIRSNIGVKVGAHIKVDELEGEILSFYPRNLKLQDDHGIKIVVPYLTLIGKPIIFNSLNKTRVSGHQQFAVNTKLTFEELSEKIKFFIMTHPKALINVYPIISILSKGNDELELDIKMSAQDDKGLLEMEFDLKKFVENL